jgi:predicted DNA-binding ribbon-helix-helix protein
MPGLRKRSLVIDGHSTSVALEPEFWAVLHDMAKHNKVSLAATIKAIDLRRENALLASSCRIAALAFLQGHYGDVAKPIATPGLGGHASAPTPKL